MMQGVFNSMGWHLHDYTQHVDLFPYQGDEQPVLPQATPTENKEKS
jgi:hypothetical protein